MDQDEFSKAYDWMNKKGLIPPGVGYLIKKNEIVMQLVYAWILDYKCFHNEEFNFGSSFIFEAATNIDRWSFKLSRKTNENYYKGLYKEENNFGIENISALVGINGTGKTTLLELLATLLTSDGNDLVYCLVFCDEDENILVKVPEFETDDELISGGSARMGTWWHYEFDFRFHYFNLLEAKDFKPIYYSPLSAISRPFRKQEGVVDISAHHFLKQDLQELNKKYHLSFLDILLTIKYSERYSEFISFFNFINGFHTGSAAILKEITSRVPQFRIEINNKFGEGFISGQRRNKNIRTDLLHLYRKITRDWYGNWHHQFFEFIISCTSYYPDNFSVDEFKSIYSEHDFLKTLIEKTFVNNTIELISFIDKYFNGESTKSLDFENGYKFFDEYVVAIKKIGENKNFDEKDVPFDLKIETSLSSGAEMMLTLFCNLFHGLKAINNSANITSEDRLYCFLLLDEPDIGLHPEWQRRFIKELIENIEVFFTYYTYESDKFIEAFVQIIFSTHSPITLSDINSSSCIFLKKPDGNENMHTSKAYKKTFAANIHEMYASSFFLEGGAIGSFAKSKVQEVIAWCSDTENKDGAKKVSEIIKIIDEPLIKFKLTELYAQKMGLSIEIEKLKVQKEYIEKRLDELNNKNNDRN